MVGSGFAHACIFLVTLTFIVLFAVLHIVIICRKDKPQKRLVY